MTLAEVIRYDLIAMIEDDPTTFQFNGTEYTGTSSGVIRRRPLEVGGFDDQPEISIAINIYDRTGADQFGANPPQVGDRITVGPKTYRIDRTEVDAMGECLQLDLRSKDK